MNKNLISVIIPLYNSEGSINELYRRLTNVLENYGMDYEIIWVNDCSTDESAEIVEKICVEDSHIKLINLSRNFGHQSAIFAGLSHVEGNIVSILDDDLQDPPELLPQFLNKMKEGYEVVYGIRKKRKVFFFKKIIFSLFYRLLDKLSKIDIPLDAGDYCIIDRKVVDALLQMPETNIYLRGLRSWVGFKQIGIEYERDIRYAGKSTYTIIDYFRLALDGILSFSYAPLRIVTITGIAIAMLSFIIGLKTIIPRILANQSVPGFTLLFVAITFIGGIQLLAIGVIGEYIARIYDESKRRQRFIIRSKVGFKAIKKDIKS